MVGALLFALILPRRRSRFLLTRSGDSRVLETTVQLRPTRSISRSRLYAPYRKRQERGQFCRYQAAVFGEHGLAVQCRTLQGLTAARCWRLRSKLADCCSTALFGVNEAGNVVVCERRCRSRICYRCARIRAKELMQRIHHLTATAIDSPAFLTLTIRSSDAPLKQQIQRLTQAFRLMRRSSEWKEHVRGGIFVIEVTWSPSRRQWHPHIHAVIDLRYWKQANALAVWERCVGDQAGFHVKRIPSKIALARYLASYVAKGSSVAALPTHRLAEWAEETHGLRLAQTFGSLHGVKAEVKQARAKIVRILFKAEDVAEMASQGHRGCSAIMRMFTHDRANVTEAALQPLLPKELQTCRAIESERPPPTICDGLFISGTSQQVEKPVIFQPGD